MTRWKAMVLGLALAAATVAGCTQQVFLSKAELENFQLRNTLPPHIATDTALATVPTLSNMPAPADVNNPEREPRYITLNECIALALENGVRGSDSTRGLGTIDDDLTSVGTGGQIALSRPDSIRVLALEPAVAQTLIETQASRYDAILRGLLSFNANDPPLIGPNRFQGGQFTQFGWSLDKPLATGGLANVTFGTNPANPNNNFYSNFTQQSFLSGTVNPTYNPELRFNFTQPLWQNFGTDINLLLPNHPIADSRQALTNTGVQQTTGFTGILIARLNYDEARVDLERNVAFMLLNVETAYWNLYSSFITLYSNEQALRISFEVWRITKARYDAGNFALDKLAQARGQYEQFRAERLQALGNVLEAERVLRRLAGLNVEDGTRLVPVDTPTLTAYQPIWSVAQNEALNLRPELIQARNDLKLRQMEVLRTKTLLQPDLRLVANYGIRGSGSSLDGNGVLPPDGSGVSRPENALRSLASTRFSDYTVGVNFTMPIGFRLGHARVREAELRLAQGFLQLKDQEKRAVNYLATQYRQLQQSYELIGMRKSARLAYAEQVETRFKLVVAGKEVVDANLQDAIRQWSTALTQEFQATADYNNALARFQFAKGTLLQHDNVVIGEGPLPECAQVRAVEHERERGKALVLRERSAPILHPGPGSCENGATLPYLPLASAPSLPALNEGSPPVPELKGGVTAPEKREAPSLGLKDAAKKTVVLPPPPPPVTQAKATTTTAAPSVVPATLSLGATPYAMPTTTTPLPPVTATAEPVARQIVVPADNRWEP